MVLKMKHPHYDVIKAWGRGETIQVRYGPTSNIWIDSVINSRHTPNFNAENVEWRIKPAVKTRKYRVALCKHENAFYTVTEDCDSSDTIESYSSGFVKWLTDWINYEITE